MKLVAFDLDDTLAPSKSPLPARMDVALRSLLDHVEVCIISGGQMGQFRTQVLDNLHATDEELSRLHLMPTCGTRYYRYEGGAWVERYAHDLDPEVAARAIDSLERHARELGLWESNPWGNIIEDRGSQITFSALGQEAPLDAKRAWDPDGTKKAALRDAVQPDVPELDVRGGGSTSVDITTRGIDKAFGMGKLVEETGIPASEMLFIGDRLDPEGNDYPVKAAGYATRAVSMGTVFQVPWTRLDSWPGDIAALQKAGFTVASLALSDDSVSLDDFASLPALQGPDARLAMVMGTEGDGLGRRTIAASDYTVKIPMDHGVDSLNVAAASAVVFWATRGIGAQ